MEQEKWKTAFDSMNLSMEEKESLWRQMEQRMTGDGNQRKITRVAVVAAAVCCIGLGVYAAISGITDGKLVNAFAKLWKIEESSQKIIQETTDYHLMLDDVYAPELIECSKKRVIFANTFGLVIYDKERQQVTGTIDLQEIHCNYFNADTLQTKILIEQDHLTVYNLSQGSVTGTCYVYDLGECAEGENGNIAALQAIETKEASSLLEKKWKQQNKDRRVSTFKEYSGGKEFDHKMYSEYSIRWSEDENTKYSTCLVIDGMEKVLVHASQSCQMLLYHKNRDTGEITREALQISTVIGGGNGNDEEKQSLPTYQYVGEDLVKKALVKCFQDDLARYSGYPYGGKVYPGVLTPGNNDVAMPLIYIAGTRQKGDVLKVYGVFRWAAYSLSGDTFYPSDEGGGKGTAYLKKTEDGYEVQKIVHPRDGAYWQTDMIKLCDGDETMASKCNNAGYFNMQKRVLTKYVKQNDLDAKYLKEFGWDPIELQ